VVAHKPRFKTHSEARMVSDHPVRSINGGFAASY